MGKMSVVGLALALEVGTALIQDKVKFSFRPGKKDKFEFVVKNDQLGALAQKIADVYRVQAEKSLAAVKAREAEEKVSTPQ